MNELINLEYIAKRKSLYLFLLLSSLKQYTLFLLFQVIKHVIQGM